MIPGILCRPQTNLMFASDMPCNFSFRANTGKPKGTLNKKTIQKLRQLAEGPAADSEEGRQAQLTLSRSQNGYIGVSITSPLSPGPCDVDAPVIPEPGREQTLSEDVRSSRHSSVALFGNMVSNVAPDDIGLPSLPLLDETLEFEAVESYVSVFAYSILTRVSTLTLDRTRFLCPLR